MNTLNKLLTSFNNLPPAARMALTVAGFGSVAGIFWYLGGDLVRSHRSRMIVAIVVVAAIALFSVFGGLLSYFSRKRSGKLTSALESQGPSRADIAEQERQYREKFKAKLAQLKESGLSVYKLPWFVLMGEPGCGKTASLLNSGLDFPFGKDELPGVGGTRNYNWWFTNEAVILDTAGRIAFHEEGATDRVEWEYFLKLLRSNRPRCPINGIIIALPAVTLDKQTNEPIGGLLRDSDEERQKKATILRERLRQLHQALGVRFPTFILVTKMDLVGGFGEYFAEIYADLTQRNQMLGWARPGPFQESYDPATFPAVFDGLYQRLRQWTLRYLQRPATEQEHGMVVTFPEAFRDLAKPLQDYIGTIFQKSPLLEPPFFRGVFFTSAVQEGAPLLDVFSRGRRGRPLLLERNLRAVESRAFFIHDFYEKKVFPEQGLVFRSAKHVALNKRKRWLVWAGSSLMGAALFTLFGVGYVGVKDLIVNPREDCKRAAAALQQPATAPTGDLSPQALADKLALAERLDQHYFAYEQPWAWWYAKAMFFAANIREPQKHVGRIHAAYTLQEVIRPAIREACAALGQADLAPTIAAERRTAIQAAAEVVCRWLGEAAGGTRGARLDAKRADERAAELGQLLAILGDLPEERRAALTRQFRTALIAAGQNDADFEQGVLRQRVALDEPTTAAAAIAVIDRLAETWQTRTRLDPGAGDPWVSYWAGFYERIKLLRARREELLELRRTFASAAADGGDIARRRLQDVLDGAGALGRIEERASDTSLSAAFNQFARYLKEPLPLTPDKRIARLADLLAHLQGQWNGELDPLEAALRRGAPEKPGATRAVFDALDAARTRLSAAVAQSIALLRRELALAEDKDLLEHFAAQGLIEFSDAAVKEPPGPGQEKLAAGAAPYVRIARDALGRKEILRGYFEELNEEVRQRPATGDLNDLTTWPDLLKRAGKALPGGARLKEWFALVQDETRDKVQSSDEKVRVKRTKSQLDTVEFWSAERLYDLVESVVQAQRGQGILETLQQMAQAANETTQQTEFPGLARLMPGYDEPAMLPFDKHRFNSTDATTRAQSSIAPKPEVPAPAPAAAKPAAPEEPTPRRRGRARDDDTPSAAPPTTAVRSGAESAAPAERSTPRSAGWLCKYHQRDFLLATLRAAKIAQEGMQSAAGADAKAAQAALRSAANLYVDRYFETWSDLYAAPRKLLDERTLELLDQCGRGALNWAGLQQFYADQRFDDESRSLAARLTALLHDAVFIVDAFEKSEREIENWVNARLDDLNQRGKSLPDRLAPIQKSAADPSRGDPAAEIAGGFVTAWRAYREAVVAHGTDKALPGGPPPLRSLLDAQFKTSAGLRAVGADAFAFTAPLLDLATHGDRLLAHHAQAELYGILAKYAGYPIGGASAPLAPDQLVAALRELSDFSKRYAEIQKSGLLAACKPSLDAAEQWARFLSAGARGLGDLGADRTWIAPVTLDVSVERLCRAGRDIFGFYTMVEVSFPLTDMRTQGPSTITFDFNEIERQTQSGNFSARLDLFSNAATQIVARFMKPNAATGAVEGQKSYGSAGPLGLLQLLKGGRLTLSTQHKGESICLEVIFRLSGGSASGVPEPIPLPSAAGPAPVMPEAAKYLSSP